MPFNSIPSKEFLDREDELNSLKRHIELRRDSMAGNVLLEGGRGVGKSELLKQLYRTTFWEDKGPAPFYYSFRTASLKGSFFVRDYFSRFICQYLAFLKREPFGAGSSNIPINRLLPQFAGLGAAWMIDIIDEFEEHLAGGDFYGTMLAAISAPVAAARISGRQVLVMLDDFNLSTRIYEANPGDTLGLTTLFEESMKDNLCPHIITGSPAGALGTIFSDASLCRQAERMRLGPLPQNMAQQLFGACLNKLEIACSDEAAGRIVGLLGGNPLYIRNLAKAAWKMHKKDMTEKDVLDCYAYEVCSGETAFYWSSVLNGMIADIRDHRDNVKLLMQCTDKGACRDFRRIAGLAGISEAKVVRLMQELSRNGLTDCGDAVFRDFVRCLFMKEIEGKKEQEIPGIISSGYSTADRTSCFEMSIPMKENAELVAAGAVEQICRNIDLDDEILNAVQIALIECCINAMEHSGSPDGKLLLKFLTSPEALVITIESSGRYFSLDELPEIPAEENMRSQRKRGWGFRLIRKTMDDVKVERAGDRTRVILTKKIARKDGASR